MYGGEQHTREAKESVGREIDSSQTLEMKHTDHTIGVFSVFFFLARFALRKTFRFTKCHPGAGLLH